MKRNTSLIKQVTFFGFVGAVSLLIDVGVTYICFHLLEFPAYIASAIGFLSAFGFNFPMNRKKVFRHTEHDRFGLYAQIIMYVVLSVLNLVITSTLVELMVMIGIEISFAKVVVTALIAVWNFLILKFFIFSKKPASITG